MRTATRMMMMGGRNDKGRYKENEEQGRMRENRYDREERGGWDRGERKEYGEHGGWERENRMKHGRGDEGRYMGREEWGEDDGGYAGRFRHGTDTWQHAEGGAVSFEPQKAKEWVAQMQNSDGTKGEHFKPEHVEQLRSAHCPDCGRVEFWAAMNMMYSDYCEVAKKMNVDKPEFYAHMAKAFLKDEDAGEEKLAKYMQYVAGK